jgi:hypothetical protein
VTKIRCRIGLQVDSKGKWFASGWEGMRDDYDVGGVIVSRDSKRYWVEVEVDVPLTVPAESVVGKVKEAT